MREDGIVLTGLAARPDGQLHGSSVWRLGPPDGRQLPFHRFAQVLLLHKSLDPFRRCKVHAAEALCPCTSPRSVCLFES